MKQPPPKNTKIKSVRLKKRVGGPLKKNTFLLTGNVQSSELCNVGIWSCGGAAAPAGAWGNLVPLPDYLALMNEPGGAD